MQKALEFQQVASALSHALSGLHWRCKRLCLPRLKTCLRAQSLDNSRTVPDNLLELFCCQSGEERVPCKVAAFAILSLTPVTV